MMIIIIFFYYYLYLHYYYIYILLFLLWLFLLLLYIYFIIIIIILIVIIVIIVIVIIILYIYIYCGNIGNSVSHSCLFRQWLLERACFVATEAADANQNRGNRDGTAEGTQGLQRRQGQPGRLVQHKVP